MAFIIDFYFVINNFMIKHIPEIVFSIIAMLIIFIEPYLVYIERAISSFMNVRTRSDRSVINSIRIDSFLVFLLLILLILPLIKHYLMNYLETALNSENLFFYLIVLFAGMYIYYVLVHRRRHS